MSSRLIRVSVTPELVTEVLKTGATIGPLTCLTGLPADAVLVAVTFAPPVLIREKLLLLTFRTATPGPADEEVTMTIVFRRDDSGRVAELEARIADLEDELKGLGAR